MVSWLPRLLIVNKGVDFLARFWVKVLFSHMVWPSSVCVFSALVINDIVIHSSECIMKRVIQSFWGYLRRLHTKGNIWDKSWNLKQREYEKKLLPEITTFAKKQTGRMVPPLNFSASGHGEWAEQTSAVPAGTQLMATVTATLGVLGAETEQLRLYFFLILIFKILIGG